MITFYCFRFESSPTWRPGPRIFIFQEGCDPILPLSTRFPFRRLLRLAGLRWRWFEPASTPCRANLLCLDALIGGGQNKKHRLQQCLQFCVRTRCRAGMNWSSLMSKLCYDRRFSRPVRTDHIENNSLSYNVLFCALTSNELFTKNLSSWKFVIETSPSNGNPCYNINITAS
jgi:hypothetical protein